MIPLHRPPYEKREQEYFMSAMAHRTGQTSFCTLCEKWMGEYGSSNVKMTSSCSTALDMAAGRIDPEKLAEIIESKDRSRAGQTAAGYALYLNKVIY